MDIYDKRESLLDLQQAMLADKKIIDEDFLTLINFENWCCSNGLPGFLQDFEEREIATLSKFASESGFAVITKMIQKIKSYQQKYGKDFIDLLNQQEYEDLTQFDDEFLEVHDDYTKVLYDRFLEKRA